MKRVFFIFTAIFFVSCRTAKSPNVQKERQVSPKNSAGAVPRSYIVRFESEQEFADYNPADNPPDVSTRYLHLTDD